MGIARSALFPTLSALASASVNQYSLFFDKFYREDLGVFPATLNLSYALLDFGRGARIDLARANVLASDFAFNDSHRKVIFQVTDTYYRLLDAIGQEDAAQATLTDAQTVQEAGEARLANGLATLPDVLEARAATAQARYELASVQGLEDIARGALAITLGLRPSVALHVEDVSREPVPVAIDEPIEALMDSSARSTTRLARPGGDATYGGCGGKDGPRVVPPEPHVFRKLGAFDGLWTAEPGDHLSFDDRSVPGATATRLDDVRWRRTAGTAGTGPGRAARSRSGPHVGA